MHTVDQWCRQTIWNAATKLAGNWLSVSTDGAICAYRRVQLVLIEHLEAPWLRGALPWLIQWVAGIGVVIWLHAAFSITPEAAQLA